MINEESIAAFLYDKLSVNERKDFLLALSKDSQLEIDVNQLVKVKEIDDFINGRMEEKVYEEFVRRAQHDSNLKKEIEKYDHLDQLLNMVAFSGNTQNISDDFQQEVMAMVKEHDQDLNEKPVIKTTSPKQGKLRRLAFIAVAASLALIVSFSFLYANFSNQNILIAEFSPYPAPSNLKGPNSPNKTQLKNALDFYVKEDYVQAIVSLEQLLDSQNDNQKASFFLGISYLKEKKYEKAIQNLKISSTSKDSDIQEASEWYLALATLGSRQTSLAKSLFEKIEGNEKQDSFYKTKSKKVLKKMNSPWRKIRIFD